MRHLNFAKCKTLLITAGLSMLFFAGYAQKTYKIKVKASPKVEISDTTVCQGENVRLYLYGTPPFTLTYDVDTNSVPVVGNTFGLPTSFAKTALDSIKPWTEIVNNETVQIGGVYSIDIPAGAVGIFKFTLNTIQDNNACQVTYTNDKPTATINVNAKPDVDIITAAEICQDEEVAITFTTSNAKEQPNIPNPTFILDYEIKMYLAGGDSVNVAPGDLGLPTTFTMPQQTPDQVKTEHGVTTYRYTHLVPAGQAGKFEFLLYEIEDTTTGCKTDFRKP